MNENEIKTSVAPTDFQDELNERLAYSELQTEPDLVPYHRFSLRRILLIALAIGTTVLVIELVYLLTLGHQQPGMKSNVPWTIPGTPSVELPTLEPVLLPPFAMSDVPNAQRVSQDSRFLAILASKGLTPRNGVPQSTIDAAHIVCTRLATGESRTDVMQDVWHGSGGTPDQATFFVDMSVITYCP